MTDLEIVLISAIIASVVTALLSYYVQQRLSEKRREEEEEQLAFVCLVKISEIVTMDLLFKEIMKVIKAAYGELFSSIYSKIKPQNGSYETIHSICVIFEKVFNEKMDEELRNKIKNTVELYKEVLNDYIDSFNIPISLLSKLPRRSVVSYNNIKSSLINVKSIIKYWHLWQKSDKIENINAEDIYNQWFILKSLLEEAYDLKKVLIDKGRIGEKEANRIIYEQYNHNKKFVFEAFLYSDKLKAASKAIENFNILEDKEDSPD